jgi:hypothetical protein
MITATRGIVRGLTVVLDSDAPIPAEGTEVIVFPLTAYGTEFDESTLDSAKPTTAGDLWRVLRNLPQADGDVMDEFERAVEDGGRPMSDASPFAELEDRNGAT